MIPYGRQEIVDEDVEAVNQILKSDFLTQGPMVPKFESALTAITGAKFATAVNSATSALHLACLALGVGKGDIVWTVPNTFVASANCALYCGAEIDFVDINPNTGLICIEKLKIKLEQAKSENKLPNVFIPVHLGGASCDMKEIGLLAQQYGFTVIEDASHAIGGLYNEQPVGNCKYSSITVFSFHPVKMITTAEGGAVMTNDKTIFKKLCLYSNNGITKNKNAQNKAIPESLKFIPKNSFIFILEIQQI